MGVRKEKPMYIYAAKLSNRSAKEEEVHGTRILVFDFSGVRPRRDRFVEMRSLEAKCVLVKQQNYVAYRN